ncbi:MAG TPA: TetR/AcrR family transcriptional regulator [Roseiflexaceae bacterium]|nr:TetR/AcrR family transcriptional regulator [Roseiflexaceae bacterium]
MAAQANDRRVQRTRRLLRDTLLALIVERGYEELTVQEIIDRADLGRATFYAHYRDKQDLLMDTFAGLRAVFQSQHQSSSSPQAGPVEHLSLRFFRHAAEYRPLYRAMVGRQSGAMLHSYAQHLLSEQLREHLALFAPCSGAPAVPVEVAVAYLTSALLGLLIWWLDHDLPYPPEQIDAMFRRLVWPGLTATFDVGNVAER